MQNIKMINLITRLNKLLNVEDQDEVLEEILNINENKLLTYLKVKELPTSLEWILIELSIQRFNRIGSEGMSSESIDGGNTSYIVDDLEAYKIYLDEYRQEQGSYKGYRIL